MGFFSGDILQFHTFLGSYLEIKEYFKVKSDTSEQHKALKVDVLKAI